MYIYKRWAIFAAAMFLMISAALVSGPHLYFMAGMLLMLPLISYLIGMVGLHGLEVSRDVPVSGWDGESAVFQIVVRSRSRIPRLFLQAHDHLPEWIEPQEPEPPLFNVPAFSETKVPYQVNLRKRGAYRLEWVTVTAIDPLGIFAFSRRYRLPAEFLVYPVPEPMPDLALTGSERYGFKDLPVASARGGGVDPDGVREYVPGDPLRRMHWKSTARTGKLNVIEFEESRAVNIVLALDLHRGSHVGHGRESTLEYLVRAAASLAETAVRQGATAQLAVGGDRDSETPGRGTDHLFAVLRGLARVEPNDKEPLSRSIAGRVGNLSAGTTLIALTSGLDTDLPDALELYTRTGVRVVVVYADPMSFDPGARLHSGEQQDKLLDRYAAMQDALYVIRRHSGGILRPEPRKHGDSILQA